VRAFAPDVLVSQCGCDTHHEDPLANLELSVDGQRQAIAEMHQLAHETTGGKWIAYGGGGYGLVRCVPRTWTHLLAEVRGTTVDPDTEVPQAWLDDVRSRGARGELPRRMGEGRTPDPQPWGPGGDSWLDRAIGATRSNCFPLLGLDPDDPRD
jgi:acetoin utilization protein AcuC